MEMIEVKAAELSGSALDWAVAKIEHPHCVYYTRSGMILIRGRPGLLMRCSRDWSQGGPLIDKYKVGTVPLNVGRENGEDDHWFATAFFDGKNHDTRHKGEGSSALIAACRAVVGLILGEVVSVPAELVEQ